MNIYQIITDTIIQKLEAGIIPWRKTWNTSNAPRNGATQHRYTGINILLLVMQGYSNPYWLTWKQIQELNGQVRAGEKHTKIVYYNSFKTEVANDKGDMDEVSIPFLKYYNVWNAEQVLLPDEKVYSFDCNNSSAKPFQPIEKCTSIVDAYDNKPTIIHGSSQPAYSKADDRIMIPYPSSFVSSEEYYVTLFHELVHSTGHASRLNRLELKQFARFGDDCYSREELTAEIGATFLCAEAGIEQPILDNSTAYIQNWLQTLKEDSRAVIVAAGKAQKAIEYILHTNIPTA